MLPIVADASTGVVVAEAVIEPSRSEELSFEMGGKIVEGYAVEPKKESMPDVFAYHGFASAYRRAGFVEVARRSATRPIMRAVFDA